MTDTVGQSVDAELAVVKAKIAVLEAAAKTDFSKVVAWVKTNALHIALTWPASLTVLAPVVKTVLKL